MIKEVIMKRDGLSSSEADALIEDAKRALQFYIEDDDFFGAENVCEEYFGLEPDYIMELI